MTEQHIYEMLHKGEHMMLECKRAMSAVPNSVWETYSAFANTHGGVVLLGVNEDLQENETAKRFTITGVEDADKICKDLWNMLNNSEKVSVNLLKDDDVQEISIDGKTIVCIKVPRADVAVRPVYINGNPLRGAFKRNHEGDYHLKNEELRMMLRDADDESNDQMLLEHYTMDDIDQVSLRQYRLLFRTDHPDHVWNNLEDKEFLKQMGGYTVNRDTGEEGLTMAGLLMFGKGLSIRERFNNLRMDFIDKSHLIGDQRYSDRLTYDGTWENNLFNFMQTVLPKLTKELPRTFQMKGVVRKDDTMQHKAVREAFTNAIIHADLMLKGILKVVKYDDRFEFTNPGLLKLPIEQIYAGGESDARNQSIQVFLRMIGYGEGIGSGFPLILSAWDEKNWKRPELIEQHDLMQVKLVLWLENVTKEGENVTNDVAKESVGLQGYGNNAVTLNVTKEDENVTNDVLCNLSDRQKAIIRMIIAKPKITVDELSERIIVNRRTILRDIKSLQEKRLLIREGGRADGRWIVNIGR